MIPFRTSTSTLYSVGISDGCHQRDIFLIVLVYDPINRCSNLGVNLPNLGRHVHCKCVRQVNIEQLVGKLLVEFRKRVSKMAIGTAVTEWPEFQDLDLEGGPVL